MILLQWRNQFDDILRQFIIVPECDKWTDRIGVVYGALYKDIRVLEKTVCTSYKMQTCRSVYFSAVNVCITVITLSMSALCVCYCLLVFIFLMSNNR